MDEREVADDLVDVATGPACGLAPEMAGPELLTLGQIAATWLAVIGAPARLLPMRLTTRSLGSDGSLANEPCAEPVLEGYRAGWNTPHGERTLGGSPLRSRSVAATAEPPTAEPLSRW